MWHAGLEKFDGGFGRKRHEDSDMRASALCGNHLQFATVKLRKGMGDGQAKSSAFVALAETGFHLAKGAHGGGNLLWRHAWASVCHRDYCKIVITQDCLDTDAAPFGCELHGVTEDVDENLLQAQGVSGKQG